MAMRILLDTNVVIDYLEKRDPFFESASKIFNCCQMDEVDGAISSQTFADAFYILRKKYTADERREMLLHVCDICHVQGLDKIMVMSALRKNSFADFEDCLQMECAIAFNADYIITRNVDDYKTSSIQAITPEDFLTMMSGDYVTVKGGDIMPVENEIVIRDVNVLKPDGKVEVANIFIKDDKIAKISNDAVENAHAVVIDGRGKFAVPGLVNAHTHASMTLLRSYSDDKALMEWLNKDIWPIEAKMNRGDIRAGAELAAVEMIKSGTTAFADMYGPFMELVAEVVEESGLRGVLCRGIIGVAPDSDVKLQENVDLYKNWHGKANGRISIMFGPHAIFTCPPDFLRKVCNEAAKLNAEIHIHMNETLDEVNGCIKNYGKRPFEVVVETGLFDLGTLAAHCVHLSDNEIEIIKAKNIRVAHNPGSNMKLASGIAPVPKLLAEGVTVALGTDGASSNNNLDMLEEIKLAALLHKVDKFDPLVIPAIEALKMGTENGAKAIGLNDVGKIEAGYKADIVLFDMSGADWQPRYNPVSLLVYSANSSSADTVIVDGKILMQNRELKTLDEEKIIANFNARADRLLSK